MIYKEFKFIIKQLYKEPRWVIDIAQSYCAGLLVFIIPPIVFTALLRFVGFYTSLFLFSLYIFISGVAVKAINFENLNDQIKEIRYKFKNRLKIKDML